MFHLSCDVLFYLFIFSLFSFPYKLPNDFIRVRKMYKMKNNQSVYSENGKTINHDAIPLRPTCPTY